MNYIFDFRLIASESVQYFQFDKEGNMYVFAPGAGFSGESKIVRPGDDIFVDESMYNTTLKKSVDHSISRYYLCI